jgi:hypothetical protein
VPNRGGTDALSRILQSVECVTISLVKSLRTIVGDGVRSYEVEKQIVDERVQERVCSLWLQTSS